MGRVTTRALLLLALGLLGGSAGAQATDGSLEAFLRRVRAEREAERERLRPKVEDLVQRLGRARAAAEVKKLQADLDALGSEAPALVTPFLDPGTNPEAEQEKRAEEVAAWLARHPDPSLFEPLLRLAREGSPLGRRLALRLLGSSQERERAAAALRTLHGEVGGSLRAECVAALARLASDDPLVVASLGDPHPEVVAQALRALTSEPRKKPRPEVLTLLEDQSRGADVLPELVAYLSFPGQTLDEQTVATLLRYASREDLPLEARLTVLRGAPHLPGGMTSRVRREFDGLVASSEAALREEALIALTLLKDGRARRELLKPYDEQVQSNSSWPLAYQRRGDVLLRIGEYRDAAKDYQEAIRLHEDSARLPGNRDLWINLARAQVKDNKLKAAADALEAFGLSSDLRKALRADPDFQPLVEHSKYGALFE